MYDFHIMQKCRIHAWLRGSLRNHLEPYFEKFKWLKDDIYIPLTVSTTVKQIVLPLNVIPLHVFDFVPLPNIMEHAWIDGYLIGCSLISNIFNPCR